MAERVECRLKPVLERLVVAGEGRGAVIRHRTELEALLLDTGSESAAHEVYAETLRAMEHRG
jgi:hypothetical protein